ncbi:hypothetical protein BJ138DRAFT_385990 [Hygrophoropsis aurantiaca]|uniref:Uncharacterized protein n=1 Tax=Hygrophoropsis aurantiaca TaxID=72124 RepID=A0ACB8AM64_9AGAM|nr:hypothetical protein BJ138DRAFT_385990 [Hygrophoropsis aurantiaca]
MFSSQGDSATYEHPEFDPLTLSRIEAELKHWESVIFRGDMGDQSQDPTGNASGYNGNLPQNGPPSSTIVNSNTNPESSSSVPLTIPHGSIAPPPQLPPEAYNYLIHALISMQGASSTTNSQSATGFSYHGQTSALPPHPSWPPPPSNPYQSHVPLQSGPPSQFSYEQLMMQLPSASHFNATSSSQFSSMPQAPANSSPQETGDQSDSETVSIAEDKRRRNTAASARFRIKKKQRTLNLERTVADLTGRTEELEREASELRRENGWLKEIVLLKGRGFGALGAVNNPQAESSRAHEQRQVESSDSEPQPSSKQRGKSRKGKEKEK